MKEKVLVIGATGFIGIRICRELYQRGYEVHALTRKSSDTSAIDKYVHGYLHGDLTSTADIEKMHDDISAKKIPHIIFAAGSVDYHQNLEEARTSNVKTVKNFIDIACRLSDSGLLQRFVFVGSVASRGFFISEPESSQFINEDSDLYKRGVSVYCDVKREAEEIVNRSVREKNLNAVIVEPGSLVGAELGNRTTTNIGLIKKIIKGIPILRGGASYTSVDALARGIINALEMGRVGESYLLGGENMPMKNFALMVRGQALRKSNYNRKALLPVITIPSSLAVVLGKLNIMINEQQALLGRTFHYIDSAKARDEIGYRHTVEDLERAIDDVIDDLTDKE